MGNAARWVNKVTGDPFGWDKQQQAQREAEAAAAEEQRRAASLQAAQVAEQARQAELAARRESEIADAERGRRSVRKRGRGLLTFAESGPQGLGRLATALGG